MLQITPENVFVFYAFEWILSGLLAFALIWFFFKNRALRKKTRLIVLLAALLVLSWAFFLSSFLHFYEFYNQRRLLSQDPENVACGFFFLAALLLGATFNAHPSLKNRWALIFAGAGILGIGHLTLTLMTPGRSHSSIHFLGISAFLLLFAVARRKGAQGWETRWLPSLTLLAFSTSFLSLFLQQQLSGGPEQTLFWILQHVTILASLVALAHFVERDTQDLFVKFFIRLNVTFILLAGFIMVVVAGVQRREYVAFAEREASDLMEFLRGHVMYFHRRGQPDPQVLVNPEITKRIVASFGNITDLKSVAIDLDGLRLDVSIAADGMVAQKIRQTRGTSTPPPFDPTIEKNLLVLATPIYRDDTITGWVQLKESVAGMNRSIARQIMIIFSAFTVTVTLSGILIGIIVTQADTTIRKQYGELAETHKRLLQAAKLAALGEMAGGVAHEINNPLGIILGRADYLSSLDGRRKLADCQEDLEVIQRNAARAGKIISDLLDFARPHPLDSQEQDLNELLSETVGFMEPRIRSSHLKIRKELSPLPPVQVDRDRMQQVFVNLINNAIDASPENGTIRLRTRADRSNSLLEVSIEDNGVGMPEEQLKKVFDPFFTTKPQGTGLGLSVSYTIVREHGGQILADSQPGRGTRFRVTLPADRGRAES